MTDPFLSELSWRGLLHQTTQETELQTHLSSAPRNIYAGFDPTADSLTIGNLIPILLLRHAQQAGHTPFVVMGGGTGLIGDPSGKSSERTLLDKDAVASNVQKQRKIFERLLDFSPGKNQAQLLNNLDWLGSLGYLEVLRDIGKHFSVNAMIQRDSVHDRLQKREQGISYTEFSYMILQAYDFFHLAKHHNVSIQMGGSDQFGNIVSGSDLIRRLIPGCPAFGITAPLLTKSDGSKFGKTEQGAIWLTADRTSPYAFYQFFLQSDDQDVMRFLRLFSFLPKKDIEDLQIQHEQQPELRHAHRALARAMTTLVHGESACKQAEEAGSALFSGDWTHLSAQAISEIVDTVPHSHHPKSMLNPGLPLLEVVSLTTLAKSKREAREFLQAGSIQLHGQKADPSFVLTPNHLLHDQFLPLRRGKKQWHILVFDA